MSTSRPPSSRKSTRTRTTVTSRQRQPRLLPDMTQAGTTTLWNETAQIGKTRNTPLLCDINLLRRASCRIYLFEGTFFPFVIIMLNASLIIYCNIYSLTVPPATQTLLSHLNSHFTTSRFFRPLHNCNPLTRRRGLPVQAQGVRIISPSTFFHCRSALM